MTVNKFILRYSGLALMLLYVSSCVKDGFPPDCKKPGKPTVQSANISIHEGDTLKLGASGPAGAQYLWSGPNGFNSASANPIIPFATITNSGTYWVKILVGYCYSDSVPANVTIIGDTTCNLGNNGADFPNGTAGPFSLNTSCSNSSNGSYQINSNNADSTIFVTATFNQKPTKGGKYNLTNNPNPGNGQVFYMITDQNGAKYTNTSSVAYVKIDNGKLNLVVCEASFPGIGVFSANIQCN